MNSIAFLKSKFLLSIWLAVAVLVYLHPPRAEAQIFITSDAVGQAIPANLIVPLVFQSVLNNPDNVRKYSVAVSFRNSNTTPASSYWDATQNPYWTTLQFNENDTYSYTYQSFADISGWRASTPPVEVIVQFRDGRIYAGTPGGHPLRSFASGAIMNPGTEYVSGSSFRSVEFFRERGNRSTLIGEVQITGVRERITQVSQINSNFGTSVRHTGSSIASPSYNSASNSYTIPSAWQLGDLITTEVRDTNNNLISSVTFSVIDPQDANRIMLNGIVISAP